MDGMKIELRQLVGKTSTAAGVFDVAQDIDMVMIETEKLGRPIHYGFIGRAAVSKFTALPHYERVFPPVPGPLDSLRAPRLRIDPAAVRASRLATV